jgi:N-acetylmuramoyl-L-alanine amidase
MVTKRRKRRRLRRRGWRTGLPYLAGALVGAAALWGLLHVSPASKSTPALPPDPVKTQPKDYAWTAQPEPAFPLPPYARFLAGVQLVLDPGHVGQRDPGGGWKRGPTGLREAEVNLRVAQFLREFLEAAGAKVVLTRETDECLDLPDKEDLRQRVEAANRWPADLFLSLHHNANGNPQPNYSSIFYHGTAADNPASLSAGRYLITGLNDALRLESFLECPLLSDYAVYERNGFAVLREAEVPALLSEASFHSNPAEETRLRDPVYNRREAYGLFLGLVRWAQAGLPRVALLPPKSGAARRGAEIVVGLDDGLSARGGWGAEQSKILPDSLVAKLDGQPVRFKLDLDKRQLRFSLPGGQHGPRRVLFVDFENIFGQHVLHPRLELN